MEYTQAQLEAMTDFELNKVTSLLIGVYHSEFDTTVYGAIKREGVINVPTPVNYCNSWSDCGPLIDECGISVEFDCEIHDDHPQSWWNASLLDRVVTMHHKNPKRAITIVYILIMQEK